MHLSLTLILLLQLREINRGKKKKFLCPLKFRLSIMNGTAIIPFFSSSFFSVCVLCFVVEAAQPIKTRQLATASDKSFFFSFCLSLLFKTILFFSFILPFFLFFPFFHIFPQLGCANRAERTGTKDQHSGRT